MHGFDKHTQPPKSFYTFSSVWSKTTLKTGRGWGRGNGRPIFTIYLKVSQLHFLEIAENL